MTYLIFVRHGHKSWVEGDQEDCTVYKNQIKHDPALIDVGLEQASRVGSYFKRRLEAVQKEYGITFNEVRVESSPFLRCLQTASKTAQELGLPIHVEYRVCEPLTPVLVGTHDGDLFESLDLKTSGAEKLQEQALGGTVIHDTDEWYEEARALYPELPVSKVSKRINLIGDHYKNKHA